MNDWNPNARPENFAPKRPETNADASEKAASFLLGNGASAASKPAPAAGDEYGRLRQLVALDELDEDETEELEALSAKYRAGTIERAPKKAVRRRQSVAGDGDRDGHGNGRESAPQTASERAAAQLRRLS